MSTGKSITTQTNFASKKLLGKAHTSNLKTDVNESIPSNVSIPSKTVFGEDIPNDPGTAFYTLYSASAGGPATVEQVYFDIVSISDTIYDANTPGGGGDEASGNGPHGYYLKLPSNYESTSSNPNAGSGVFTNGKRLYDSRGELQLVPPLISNASPNRYFIKLYKGDPSDAANEITSGDTIDWQFDYYAGVIFIQDYDATKVPLTASAYLYVGEYLDEKINGISGSSGGGGIFTQINGTNAFTTSSVAIGGNSTPNHRLAVSGAISASLNISASAYFGDGSNLTGITGSISYSRRAVSSHATASISDRLIGVSGAAAIQIQLPSAGDYTNGQYFTIKDESGASDTKNITIIASGSQTIDGENSVVLESPYAALQLYSNGTDKFFIF